MPATIKTTPCPKCGAEIKYTTKKPEMCRKCKSKGVVRKNKRIPKKSALEFKVQDWVAKLFPDRPFIANGYYSWMKSPKGYPLQIDLLLYGSKPWIAIEVEGIQHYKRQNFQSVDSFQYLVTCDQIKEEALKQRGIVLVKIPYECKTIEDFYTLYEKEAGA